MYIYIGDVYMIMQRVETLECSIVTCLDIITENYPMTQMVRFKDEYRWYHNQSICAVYHMDSGVLMIEVDDEE